MANYMEDVLRKLGWNSGFRVPIANAENKALEEQLEKLMLKKAKAATEYDNCLARFKALEKHLIFVKQEDSENQNLITTYKQQLDSENHKYLLTQSEKDRVNQEVRQIQKQFEDTQKRNDDRKTDLNRGVTKLERLKNETSWDVEALKAWEESLKKRDDDNELLKKIAKEDEKKAIELETRRLNTQTEVINRKQTLARVVLDITNYEQILERTAKLFKHQKEERDALIKQWQDSVRNLRQRDEAVNRLDIEINAIQNLTSQQQASLEQQDNFYRNQLKNNKDLEREIEITNAMSIKIKLELNELIQNNISLNCEVNALKKSMVSSANFLEKERVRNRNLVKDIQSKRKSILELQTTLEKLQIRLNDIKNSSLTSAERAKQMEQLIDHEQRHTKILEADIERMQGILFRSQQSLNELKSNAKTLHRDIELCETTTNLLRKQAKTMFNELQKQNEIVYDLDFRINEMERKLKKLEGESSSDDDKQLLDEKVSRLEKQFAEYSETKNTLQNQANRTEDEMRRITSALAMDNVRLESLRSTLNDEIYLFEGSTKHIAAAKLRCQQVQVEENLLRLKVNQFERAMTKENGHIYNLQKYKLELETAMKERQIEINTNKEILFVKRRNLNEEKARLKCDIMGRHLKIQTLQKKLHIAMGALGTGEDGQPLSIAHFKIKNSQEKYMLQQEGDELDTKIKKAEKEIVAMENTLEIVNITNATYKQSLSNIDEDGEEVQEMNRLQKELNENTSKLGKHKRTLMAKQPVLDKLMESYRSAEEIKYNITDELFDAQKQYSEIESYNSAKLKKIHTAEKHLHVLSKALRNMDIEKHHKNLLIRFLQDANKSALQQLAEMSARYQEVTPLVLRYTSFHKLHLPGSRRTTPTSSSDTMSTLKSIRSAKSDDSANMTQVVLTFPEEDKTKKRYCDKYGRRLSQDK